MFSLGSECVKPGDLVTLLWGVESPILIRPRENGGFYLLGDAYVDGIMYGEFLKTEPLHEVFEIH